MQNFIDSIYINNNLPLSYLKNDNNITNPIQNNRISPSVSFKGTEALAAYNYSIVNKNELFNLPIIKPLNIPTKVEDIKGEKIYNSNGDLVRIINDNTTYYFRDNGLHYSITKENNPDVKWEMFYDNGIFEGISKNLPDGTEYSTWYKDGKPVQITKYKKFSDGNDIKLEYLPNEGEYSISKHYTENGKQYSSFAYYDKNRKCIEAFESEGMHNESTDLYLMEGKPYSRKTVKSESIDSNTGKNDIDLTNLEPSPFYNIDINKINAIEGERKYYSNGKLEKIISNNGDVYSFEPEGILQTIENENKKTEFLYNYKDGIIHGHNITETMSDGGIKKTQYGNSSDDWYNIWYENKGIEKQVMYNDKGNIVSYSNKQNGKKEISRDYDDNGNLIRCWDK